VRARNRRHLLSETEGIREVWPAFTDVMSTLSLILFVLVLLAYVRNLVSSQRLDALAHQISSSERQLRTVNDDLQRTSSEVAAGKAALALSEAKVHEQEAVVAKSAEELGAVRSQLQSIAVLRVDVLTKLKDALEAELGAKTEAGTPLVTIGDNGNVVLNESLVFESGSYAVKRDARPLLDGLARALGALLADAAVRDNIDAVVIQGHTDDRGTAEYNWDLSAKRATAVVDYLFHANKTLADSYGRYFSASAYSKFRPLDDAGTPAAYQENRRIEISVIPRDANVRKVIEDYVQNTPMPPSPAPSPSP
jgi:chemotaxis protein MotB